MAKLGDSSVYLGGGEDEYDSEFTKMRRGKGRQNATKELSGIKDNGDFAGDNESDEDGTVEVARDYSERRSCRGFSGTRACKSKGVSVSSEQEKPPKRKKDEPSLMCHQCQRNDKGRVVSCTCCKTKRFCIPCLNRWYPQLTEEDIAEKCPVCRENCNCKKCLCCDKLIKIMKYRKNIKKDEELEHCKYLLQSLLPYLRQLYEEEKIEKEIEAKRQGLSVSEFQVEQADCSTDDRVYCDNCRTSIFDYHRSCQKCSFDLCLVCCHEIRQGQLLGGAEPVKVKFISLGMDYLHGGKEKITESRAEIQTENCNWSRSRLKVTSDGGIPCPRIDGGCGHTNLELRCIFPGNWISELVMRAENVAKAFKLGDAPLTNKQWCSCFNVGNNTVRKAASREGPSDTDNYLFCPRATDLGPMNLKHFQWHWSKGEPVIVSNILECTTGLSWEPPVMWRAFRQIRKSKVVQHLDVRVIDCLDWCEKDISIHQFFRGYTEGRYDCKLRPQILKLEDWPPSTSFEERVPRHCAEFLSSLPYKEYTDPHHGVLNLASMLPDKCMKPDIGPKTYIDYGILQELGRGDSVSKLRCNMSDAVYVLMHTAQVPLNAQKLANIKELKQKHIEEDRRELYGCDLGVEANVEIGNTSDFENTLQVGGCVVGGAIWDVFRRQDLPKLQEYLRKHFREFRHVYGCRLQQVIHPIHDVTFYLTMEHKKKLKEEYGIEPWTFIQKLGDAVLIPAGCPYQVRNLMSCIKVALDFVSPESIAECFHLTKEFRKLPINHEAAEDKLEVKKMTIYATRKIVKILEEARGTNSNNGSMPTKKRKDPLFNSTITSQKRKENTTQRPSPSYSWPGQECINPVPSSGSTEKKKEAELASSRKSIRISKKKTAETTDSTAEDSVQTISDDSEEEKEVEQSEVQMLKEQSEEQQPEGTVDEQTEEDNTAEGTAGTEEISHDKQITDKAETDAGTDAEGSMQFDDTEEYKTIPAVNIEQQEEQVADESVKVDEPQEERAADESAKEAVTQEDPTEKSPLFKDYLEPEEYFDLSFSDFIHPKAVRTTTPEPQNSEIARQLSILNERVSENTAAIKELGQNLQQLDEKVSEMQKEAKGKEVADFEQLQVIKNMISYFYETMVKSAYVKQEKKVSQHLSEEEKLAKRKQAFEQIEAALPTTLPKQASKPSSSAPLPKPSSSSSIVPHKPSSSKP